MKKIVKISAILATLAFAGNAFAVVSLTGSTTIGGGIYSVSKSVTLKAISTGSTYSASSQHSQGNKQFATMGGQLAGGADPTKIYSAPSQAGGPAAPTSATALPGGVTWQ